MVDAKHFLNTRMRSCTSFFLKQCCAAHVSCCGEPSLHIRSERELTVLTHGNNITERYSIIVEHQNRVRSSPACGLELKLRIFIRVQKLIELAAKAMWSMKFGSPHWAAGVFARAGRRKT